MAQRIVKTITNKIQIWKDGQIDKSLQCNVSYRTIGDNQLILEDTAGQKASIFADQVDFTQLQPAAAVAASFANAQVMAVFLDTNFFAG
jgi:hypothetical protein